MGYVDMHNHLLWGVDDGAKTEKESLRHLNALKHQGVDIAVLTPHMNSPYVPHGCADEETIRRRFAELNAVCSKEPEKYPELILGSEYYYDVRREKTYRGEGRYTPTTPASNFHPIPIGNTDWVLLELPEAICWEDVVTTIFKVSAAGFRVFLAHPEKVASIAEKVEEMSYRKPINAFKKYSGLYMQTEAWDISQGYETACSFVNNWLTCVLGTDSHGDCRPPVFDKAVEKLREIVDCEDYLQGILGQNARRLLAIECEER